MRHSDPIIRDLAARHGISEASVIQLADGLIRSGGTQVQFTISELGGMGQWMPGMVMAGDMFNHAAKGRIDAICSEIAQLVRSGTLRPVPVAPSLARAAANSLERTSAANWWSADLGVPASQGSQNGVRYAWFPASRRLAVELDESVTIYDTGDHHIGGIAQRQGTDGMTITFTSQHGIVELSRLPLVSRI